MWLQAFAINFHLKLAPTGVYAYTALQFLMIWLPKTWAASHWLIGTTASWGHHSPITWEQKLSSEYHSYFGTLGEGHRSEAGSAHQPIRSCRLQLPAGGRPGLPGRTRVWFKVF